MPLIVVCYVFTEEAQFSQILHSSPVHSCSYCKKINTQFIVVLGAVLWTVLAWLHISISAIYAEIQNTAGMWNTFTEYIILQLLQLTLCLDIKLVYLPITVQIIIVLLYSTLYRCHDHQSMSYIWLTGSARNCG